MKFSFNTPNLKILTLKNIGYIKVIMKLLLIIFSIVSSITDTQDVIINIEY